MPSYCIVQEKFGGLSKQENQLISASGYSIVLWVEKSVCVCVSVCCV